MEYLGQRQSVLAQNIANADTPDYKPQDLKDINFEKMAKAAASGVSLKTTHPGHISGSSFKTGSFATENQKSVFETTPTGNAVVLEEQMMKMAKNAMDYKATTSLYRKMASLVNIAVDNK